MSFLSFEFAIFAALALLIFHLVSSRWRPCLLLIFSYAFYLSWSPIHALLLAGVTAVVYLAGLSIQGCASEKGKFARTTLGVVTLLVLLFAFKSAIWFSKMFHADPAMIIVVPLGLSYYVFKMVGYLLHVYWEALPAQRNFMTLALYGAFFPQIVSGPVQRAGDFFSQIEKLKTPDPGEFATGLRRILFGLFKKIVIADYLAGPVASVYADPSHFSSLELLFGAYCFAIELYADFSGITDIAIGIGQLFGIKGPENFDLPYYSPNIQAFWRRWHMSLTSWLTDYWFTPLRMSLRKLGSAGLYLAIVLNFIAIGLWHGLTWVFLFFGLLNGIFMVVSVMTLKQRNKFFQTRPTLSRIRSVTGPLVTFHLMVFALIFFRSETLSSAFNYIARMVPGWGTRAIPITRFDQELLGVSLRPLTLCFVAFLATDAVTWAMGRKILVEWFFTTPVFFRRALYCALAMTVLLFFKGSLTFIYARF